MKYMIMHVGPQLVGYVNLFSVLYWAINVLLLTICQLNIAFHY